jgi:hypothetical protein
MSDKKRVKCLMQIDSAVEVYADWQLIKQVWVNLLSLLKTLLN